MQLDLLTSLPAASPAKTSVTLGRRLGLKPEQDRDFGPNTAASLANYDHATSSWKTSQLCLNGTLAEWSETWPKSGMTRNGMLFPLPPLVPLSFENESGF